MNRLARWCCSLSLGIGLCFAPAAAQQSPLTPAQADAYRAAVATLNQGETARAIGQLETLARLSPRNFAVSESLGLALARAHHWQPALRWLQLAVELRPDLAVARNNLGVTWLQAGHLDRARAVFQQAAQQHPEDFDSQYNYGQALAQAGQLQAAAAPLRQAWQLRPQPEVGYNLALALYRGGQPAAAAEVLRQLPPGIADAQSLWGDVEEKLGHYQQAARHFQAAATLAPSEPHLFRLGMEFLQHWTLDAAIAVLARGHQQYPASLRLATALAMAQYGKGDYAPALGLMSRLVAQAPGNAQLMDFFGTACTSSAAGAPACANLAAFARQHPGDGRAAAWAAGILLHQAQADGYSAASLAAPRALLQRALRLAPDLAETQFQAGLLDSIEHRWPQAVAHLRQARRLRPGDEDIHFKLAQAYQHNGQKAQALAELRRHQAMIQRQQSDFDRRYQAIQHFLVQVGSAQPKRSGTTAPSASPAP